MSALLFFLCSCHQDKFLVYVKTLGNKALSDSNYCFKVLRSVMSDFDFSSSVSFDLSEFILIC